MQTASRVAAFLLLLNASCVEAGLEGVDAGPSGSDAPDVNLGIPREDGPRAEPFLDADPAPDAPEDTPVAAPPDASPDGRCSCGDFFTGCRAGSKCTFIPTGVQNAFCVGCRATVATGAQGDACKFSSGAQEDDGCAPGFLCHADRCARACDPSAADPQCPPERGYATACGPEWIYGLHVCQTPACDLLAQTGCMGTDGCYAVRTRVGVGGTCLPPGSLPPGADCTAMPVNACEKGSSCEFVPGDAGWRQVCRRHCDRMGGDPTCAGAGTGGSVCQPPLSEPPALGPRLGFCG
jgi:hypothetical protein